MTPQAMRAGGAADGATAAPARVLVTGGAGYIGAHAVLALADAGHACVVLDNLSTGRRAQVPAAATFVEGDVGDAALVGRLLRAERIDAVMHFAGSIIVPESIEKPLLYYRNNTAATLTLVEACVAAGVSRLIYSSTAAVYGAPAVVPIPEDAPTLPINPYGVSKLAAENIVRDAGTAHGLATAALRYFNVAGADPAGRAGQSAPVSTHLIKIACEVATGARGAMTIFGDDYPTEDGTCVRDYVHVSDLAQAHVLALERLLAGETGLVLNCGYGRGFSVREVLRAVERAAGRTLAVTTGPRRPGDPPVLVAAAERIRRVLGWSPRHDSLDVIVGSALAWEQRLQRAAPAP